MRFWEQIMTEFDQLGLFSTSKDDFNINISSGVSKLLLNVEFSNGLSSLKIDDMIKKITQDIILFDQNAVITAERKDESNWTELGFFAIDVETTGLDASSNRVIELALVPFNMPNLKPFSQLFCVEAPLPQEIIHITGISDDMLKDQPGFATCADKCLQLMKQASFVVAYNAKFDRPFLESEMARVGKVLPNIPWIDPFVFICEIDRFKRGKKLSDVSKRWGISHGNAHRALADAQAAGELILKLSDKISCHTLNELIIKQKIWQWQNAHHMAELKRGNNWSINR
jgi:DNA polymerase III subunit epsilon